MIVEYLFKVNFDDICYPGGVLQHVIFVEEALSGSFKLLSLHFLTNIFSCIALVNISLSKKHIITKILCGLLHVTLLVQPAISTEITIHA